MVRTSHIMLPQGSKMNSLRKSIVGSGNSFILDGGRGGQSSYNGIDDYIKTTNKNPRDFNSVKGNGLADKITSKLSKLNIAPPTSKPKLKNITLSI
jgi:hypothetical protein